MKEKIAALLKQIGETFGKIFSNEKLVLGAVNEELSKVRVTELEMLSEKTVDLMYSYALAVDKKIVSDAAKIEELKAKLEAANTKIKDLEYKLGIETSGADIG